jgi:arylsulfatase A-like enzyme/Flp pilus assembly protein TadD
MPATMGGVVVHRSIMLAALAALTAGGCGRPGSPTPLRLPAGTPVVLVSIDTLRSDHLPAYGYEAVATPAIDRLRDDSLLFERAYAPAPMTLASHASILTGLVPPRHGVRDNLGYRLASQTRTLAEVLREHKYATGGFVSAFVLRDATGLDAGFERYDDDIELVSRLQLGELQRPGGATLAAALAWLDDVHGADAAGAADAAGEAGGRPFFLFLHLYEPHSPYDPPEPFASRYDSAYDGEVAAADAVVGDLLAALEERRLYDPALIVLLSDHGEGLGDHGESEHGILLYREALQVPLLVKLPAGHDAGDYPKAATAAPAGLVDVTPTVLALLGIEPDGELDGRPLLTPSAASPGASAGAPPDASGRSERGLYAETFYPRLHFGWSDLASIIAGRHHLIQGPEPELYDLLADPRERRNLLGERRRDVARLRKILESYDRSLAPPAAADEETRRKLAALGYLGSVAPGGDGPLANPRDRLPVLEELRRAYAAFSGRRFTEAAGRFRRILDSEPRLVDAWNHYGQSLAALGRRAEALAAYRRGLELSGGATNIALSAASLYLEMGQLDEAASHAELAVADYPSARDLLAQVALARGDLDAAERHTQIALATGNAGVGPHLTTAQIALDRGRPEAALAATDEVLREFGDRPDLEILTGLHFIRGQAFARLGEAEKAERAFRREIELFPAELGPYAHLALLQSLRGERAGAARVLREMVDANPRPEAYAEAVRTLRVLGDAGSAAELLAYARRRWPASEELRALSG